MLNVKRTKICNNLLQPIRKINNNRIIYFSFALKEFSLENNNNSIFSFCSNSQIHKKLNPFKLSPINNSVNKTIKKSFSTQKNINQNQNNSNNKSLSNKNICFLKKLENFRNNGVKFDVYNTECVFQTIWSNFAFVSYLNENKTFNNNLEKSEIDFIRTDDDSYTIFQDESAFVDFEEQNKTENYSYKTENENSSTLQKFFFTNLNENNDKKNKNNEDKHTLITRIPQEFNINLNTNKDVKIVNMGDSKLLADKEIKINFIHFANNNNNNNNKNQEIEKQTAEEAVNLEMRRIRSNNISITAEKGFKVKLTARSYLEAESLNISLQDSCNFRVKKIGVAENGKIYLHDSQIDIRSVFSPNKLSYKEDKVAESLNKNENHTKFASKHLEFSCENSSINIGSLQGNNYLNLNNCDLIIDNVDCDNFILKSTDTKSIEIFINSLEKLEENDFFYLNFSDDSNTNNNKINNNFDSAKNKKIFLNQEYKNDMLIININSAALKLLKNLDKEENEFEVDSDSQNKIFSVMHGESNFLSLLIENNKNLFDIDQIKRSYVQFLKDLSGNKKDSLLSKLKENSLFSQLDTVVDKDVAENLILINFYFLNVLLKDITNSYKIVFVDANNVESFEIKDITLWDITKKRIQNKMSISHKRVNN